MNFRFLFVCFSPAESGLDLDLRYIENVLIDYDRQYLQTSESGGCHPGTLEQLAEFKMASKRVAIYKELAIFLGHCKNPKDVLNDFDERCNVLINS